MVYLFLVALLVLGGSSGSSNSRLLPFPFFAGAAFGLVALVFVLLLELGVLLIQAFVFTLLSGIYLRDALDLH